MEDFEALGGSRLTRYIYIIYVVLSLRTLPRTMDFTHKVIINSMILPGKSAATKRPKCLPLFRQKHVLF